MPVRIAKQADNSKSELDHRALGLAALEEERWIEAAAHIEVALKSTPDDVEMIVAIASAYQGLGDGKSARSWYNHAIKVNPESFVANLRLSKLLAGDGRTLEAAGYACRALEIDPTNAEAARIVEALRPKAKAIKPAPKKKNKPQSGPTQEEINSTLRWINSALAKHSSAATINPGEHPTLSLCLIVKDEERFIEECLKSVDGVATEMIVVDTGSTDHTTDIARALGAEVHSFKWNNSFSDAKNFAIGKATGEWILVLDADERLDRGAINTVLKAINSDADAFELLFYNYSSDGPNADYGTHRTCRLFRNRPEFRYAGRVHEAIVPSVKAAGGRVEKLEAIVHHYGYKPEIVKERGKHERYITLLEADLADKPDDARCLYNLGQTCSAAGETEKAIECLSRAAEIVDPKEEFYASAVYHTYAACLCKLGALNQTIAICERADGLGIRHPQLSFVRGVTLARQRRFTEAVVHFQTAIKMGQSGSYVGDASTWGYKAYAAIALAYVALTDYRHADGYAAKAVEMKPDDMESQELLARVFNHTRGSQAYEKHLLKVQLTMSNNPNIAVILGQYYLGQERYAEARKQFERVIELGGDSADIRSKLGQCFVAQGKLVVAEDHFRQALKFDPDIAGGHHGIGLVCASEGRVGDAMEMFVKALECNPTYGPAYVSAGDLLAAMGNYQKAVDLYQNAIQCNPEDPDHFASLGNCFLGMHATEAAVLAFRQALTLDSSHKAARQGLARAEESIMSLQSA